MIECSSESKYYTSLITENISHFYANFSLRTLFFKANISLKTSYLSVSLENSDFFSKETEHGCHDCLESKTERDTHL